MKPCRYSCAYRGSEMCLLRSPGVATQGGGCFLHNGVSKGREGISFHRNCVDPSRFRLPMKVNSSWNCSGVGGSGDSELR